jgi:hypothetical protein
MSFSTLVRIGIAVAIINGTARTAGVYWTFYQFEDAAQQLALFGKDTPVDVLYENVVAKAGELQVPIAAEQINVSREGLVTTIQANYQHPVEYFPRRTYPLKLSFSVEGRALSSNAPGLGR